jgi:hypothetical protein
MSEIIIVMRIFVSKNPLKAGSYVPEFRVSCLGAWIFAF